jgi:hypothetical protein
MTAAGESYMTPINVRNGRDEPLADRARSSFEIGTALRSLASVTG